jgi:hypothetical protein
MKCLLYKSAPGNPAWQSGASVSAAGRNEWMGECYVVCKRKEESHFQRWESQESFTQRLFDPGLKNEQALSFVAKLSLDMLFCFV